MLEGEDSVGENHISVTVEDREQFHAAAKSRAADIIYIDLGCFRPEGFQKLKAEAENCGAKLGLRFPAIFRKRARDYIEKNYELIKEARFSSFLFRELESLSYLRERGIFEKGPAPAVVLDHSIYCFSELSTEAIEELLDIEEFTFTLPLELSKKELIESFGSGKDTAGQRKKELVVYGRAPMMVSAQCVKKTKKGCDAVPELLYLKDRTGRRLPVKNYCTNCYNVIYNEVPTLLCDLEKDLGLIEHDGRRYEFTIETAAEISDILCGKKTFAKNGSTKAWFRRGVM